MIRKQMSYWEDLTPLEMMISMLFMMGSMVKTIIWLVGGV